MLERNNGKNLPHNHGKNEKKRGKKKVPTWQTVDALLSYDWQRTGMSDAAFMQMTDIPVL